MANLAITTTEVVAGTVGSPSFDQLVAAEVIDPGEVYYINAVGQAALADNSTAIKAAAKGIAVSGALVAGQYIVGQKNKKVVLGATAAVGQGTPYFLSGTPGKICPAADLAAEDYVTPLGIGGADDDLVLGIAPSGIAVPAA